MGNYLKRLGQSLTLTISLDTLFVMIRLGSRGKGAVDHATPIGCFKVKLPFFISDALIVHRSLGSKFEVFKELIDLF